MKIKPKVSYKINKASSSHTIDGILNADLLRSLVKADPELLVVKSDLLAKEFGTYLDLYGLADKIKFRAIPVKWINSKNMDMFIEILLVAKEEEVNPSFIISDLVSKLKYIETNFKLSKGITIEGIMKYLKVNKHDKQFGYHFIGNPVLDIIADFFTNYNFTDVSYWGKVKEVQKEYLEKVDGLLHLDNPSFYLMYGKEKGVIADTLEDNLAKGTSIIKVAELALGFPKYYEDYPYYSQEMAKSTDNFTDINLFGYYTDTTNYLDRDLPYFVQAYSIARIVRKVSETIGR